MSQSALEHGHVPLASLAASLLGSSRQTEGKTSINSGSATSKTHSCSTAAVFACDFCRPRQVQVMSGDRTHASHEASQQLPAM